MTGHYDKATGFIGALPLAIFASLTATLSSCTPSDTRQDDAAEDTDEGDRGEQGQDSMPDELAETLEEVGDTGGPETGETREGWQEPVYWRSPLEDYVDRVWRELGREPHEFDHSIRDLEVFDDRLYLGYGDWSVNTGPIVVRYFDDPEGDFTDEFTVQEESIDHYRVMGTSLYIPGPDSREAGGRVFVKPSGGQWRAGGVLEYALHVLDVVEYQGSLYAAGAGIHTLEHYYTGEDRAILWVSADGGETWTDMVDYPTTEANDIARWERFVRTSSKLYCLGQVIVIDDEGYISRIIPINRRLEGGTWVEANVLPGLFVSHTYQLTNDVGVVTGLRLAAAQLYYTAYRVTDARIREIRYFKDGGERVVDVFVIGAGEAIFLARESNSYPDDAVPPYRWAVYRTPDAESFEELLVFESSEQFTAIAMWRGSLYFGSADGEIFRSMYLAGE